MLAVPVPSAGQGVAVYLPRDPNRTVWLRILTAHLSTFLEAERDLDDPASGVPDFVERELRAVVTCGSPALGFLRVGCEECRHEMLVPWSCHARAACPSCGARRMAETAAVLVDHVLPDVALRHWIVTPPLELQGVLLAKGGLVTKFAGLAVTAIFRHLELAARALGIKGGKGGAVVFVQRGSSTLRPFLHLHILVLDGLFTKAQDDLLPSFHELPAPSPRDEERVSADICARFERLLRRSGLVDPDRAPPSRLELWYARAGRVRAELATVNGNGDVELNPRGQGRRASTGEVAGFSVHARTAVAAGDKDGRERLAKYVAHPPFAHAQLSETSDSRVAVELRTKRPGGGTHAIVEPLDLIRRIGWMIPPPGRHTVIYRGVLAPSAKWRSEIVPIQVKTNLAPDLLGAAPGASDGPKRSHNRRIAWAQLLARTWRVDALKCPHCDGRMRVIAAITDPEVVTKILKHLGVSVEPPSLAPPHWPP